MRFLFLLAIILLSVGCLNGGPQENVLVNVNSDEGPVAGASVKVLSQSQVMHSLSTDSKGSVSVSLPPGEYMLKVNAQGFDEEEVGLSVSGDGSKFVDVSLSKTGSCIESWTCTEWSECVNNTKKRSCFDENDCGSEEEKPDESMECVVKPPPNCTKDSDCSDSINCTLDECVDGSCVNKEITYCKNDDGCCPSGCQSIDKDCPPEDFCDSDVDCDDENSCTEDECVNDECVHTEVIDCRNDDGCCPAGCSSTNDNDCSQVFQCTGDSDCDNGNPCTDDFCSAGKCFHTSISSCLNGDGCCPPGCSGEDDDCSAENECYTNQDCSDGDECTLDVCSGIPSECSNPPITECVDGDGCCLGSCGPLNDTDCYCSSNADCENDNPCTSGFCNPEGVCVQQNSPNNTACDNGVCCSGECIELECSQDSDCGTDTVCATYSCMNPGVCGAECVEEFEEDDTDCGDGKLCCNGVCKTIDCWGPSDCSVGGSECLVPKCDGAGTCNAICSSTKNDAACNDGIPCTEDYCAGMNCENIWIHACVNGDNCCPDECNSTNDSDC